jgi:4-hydroxybenzoate polyprenyltransferase
LVLGLALACAPGGAWYAITGSFDLLPLWLMAGVCFWVGGFDVLYSCQDAKFDKDHGLCSVPSHVGIPMAFTIARVLHALSCLCLMFFGLFAGLGPWYYLGLAVFSGLLANQHCLVSPKDLSNIDKAFFTRNGQASLVFFLFVVLDVALA